mmetsp:Transcript_10609/g.25543  ORF Transcript_10609/g.25543 Transcript_10609/m.25543 type:complete len:98 (-) Transcript_10609:123-416(-)
MSSIGIITEKMAVVNARPRFWESAKRPSNHFTIVKVPAHNLALALERSSCTKITHLVVEPKPFINSHVKIPNGKRTKTNPKRSTPWRFPKVDAPCRV